MKKLLIVTIILIFIYSCTTKKKCLNERISIEETNTELREEFNNLVKFNNALIENINKLEIENQLLNDDLIICRSDTTNLEKEIFITPEKMPQFPGGEIKLYEYLETTIKYPILSREKGIKGKVYIEFIIEKSGKVTNVNVIRGIDENCNREAIRVIRLMPKWEPGERKNEKIRVKYTLPIVFNLN